MQLDYAMCRCKAWLNALRNAVGLLPANLPHILASRELDINSAEIAICSLLFPVEVVTPEFSAGLEIKVYLQTTAGMTREISDIIADPLDLMFRILLINEMQQKLRELSETWPTSITPGSVNYPLLEKLTHDLNLLWQALTVRPNNEIEDLVAAAPQSFVLKLMLLQKKNILGRYAGYFSLLEEIKDGFAKLSAHISPGLRKMLSAYIIYLQGSAQMRLGQLALAERTFAEIKKEPGSLSALPMQGIAILLDDATLMRLKDKTDEMCQDLTAACGLGNCHALGEARLRGFCVARGMDATNTD